MPIDPSIVLGLKPPPTSDPFTEAAQYKNLISETAYRDQQRQTNQANEERLNKQNAEADRKLEGDKLEGQLISQHTTTGPDGSTTIDHGKVMQGLAAAGQGDRAASYVTRVQLPIEKEQLSNQAAKIKASKDKLDVIGAGLQSLTSGSIGNLPERFDAKLAELTQQGFLKPGEVPPAAQIMAQGGLPALQQFVQQHAASAIDADKQITDHQKDLDYALQLNKFKQDVAEKAPETAQKWTAAAGQLLGAADTPEHWDAARETLIKAGAPLGIVAQFGEFGPDSKKRANELGMTSEQRQQSADKQKELDQTIKDFDEKVREFNIDSAETKRYHDMSTEGVTLTPQAKTKMAEMFATTGVLPSLGMGKEAAKTRSEIINEAAKNFPQVDFATNKAAYQANTTSLKNLQKQQDALESFENTAGKNLDQFITTAKSVIDSGSPLINKPLRAITGSVLGTQNQAAFNTARQVAVTEIAKVLNNPNGSAAVSDSNRKEIQGLIGPDATLGQIYRASEILRADMKNRRDSGREEIKAITDRIGKSGAPAGETSAHKVGDVVDVGGKKVKITVIHGDGTFDGDPVK